MKAVFCTRYGAPEVLQIKEIDKPSPQGNEILIKIYATSVTVADTRVRSFTVPPSFWLPARLALGLTKPRKQILGVELSGEVEKIGKDVKLFKKGDKVFAATLFSFGSYAEYKCLPENGPIAILPKNCSFEEAAALPVGARTALHFLRKANIKKEQKILIYGASGSVGTYAVQLAKYFGANVTAICSTSNIDLVKSLGADRVVDYTKKDYCDKLELYDVVFLAVDKFPFSVCGKLMKKEGTYINITSPIKTFSMIWTSMTSRKKIIMAENSSETAEDLNFLKGLVERGSLKAVIDRSYNLDQIVEAHRYVDKGHKKGNVVVKVG